MVKISTGKAIGFHFCQPFLRHTVQDRQDTEFQSLLSILFLQKADDLLDRIARRNLILCKYDPVNLIQDLLQTIYDQSLLSCMAVGFCEKKIICPGYFFSCCIHIAKDIFRPAGKRRSDRCCRFRKANDQDFFFRISILQLLCQSSKKPKGKGRRNRHVLPLQWVYIKIASSAVIFSFCDSDKIVFLKPICHTIP